jgi:hypothetical protein
MNHANNSFTEASDNGLRSHVRQLNSDPLFLVMVFGITAVFHDPFGILLYVGIASLAKVVYLEHAGDAPQIRGNVPYWL